MALPADAVPINQSSNSSRPAGLPSDAVEINQGAAPQGMPEDAVPIDSTRNDLYPVPSGPKPFEKGVLSPTQEALYATATNPESQLRALVHMGFDPKQISVNDKGKFVIGDKEVESHGGGWADYLRNDFLGSLAAGSVKLMPAIGQVGGEALALAGGPLSLTASAGAQAAGSAGGELLRQLIGKSIYGGDMNASEVALQGTMGAVTPYVGKYLLEKPIVATGKMLGNITRKLGDASPAVLSAITSKPEPIFDRIKELQDNGVDLSTVFNDKVASNEVPEQLFRRVFAGDDKAPLNIDNIHKTFIKQLSQAKDDVSKNNIINLWSQTFKNILSPQTFSVMAKTKPGELSDNLLTNENALMNNSRDIHSSLENMDDSLGKEVSRQKYTVLNTPDVANKPIDIQDILSSMLQGYKNDVRLLSENGQILPRGQGMESPAAKSMLQTVLGRLKSGGNLVSRRPSANAEVTLSDLINASRGKGAEVTMGGKVVNLEDSFSSQLDNPKFIENIKTRDAIKLLEDLQPVLNRTFNGETIPSQAKTYLESFLKGLRTKIGDIAPEYAASKSAFKTFRDNMENIFGENGLSSNVRTGSEQIAKFIKNAYTNPDLQAKAMQLDSLIGDMKGKILPLVEKINASQELSQINNPMNMSAPIQGWIGNMRNVLNPTDQLRLQNEALSNWNSALPKSSQFLDDAKNHIVANEMSSTKFNPFRLRAMFYILGGAGLMHVNPLIGGGSLMGVMAASNPAGVAKLLAKNQRLQQSIEESSRRMASRIKTIPGRETAGKAALAVLLRQVAEKTNRQE